MNMGMNFKPINWVQGMNVSSAHFVATENYFSEKIFQSISLCMNEFSYGLLPQKDGVESLSLSLRGRGEQTKVVLKSYNGIVPGGVVVCLDRQEEGLECSCDTLEVASEDGWNVVLSVSPFDRNPCGVPNMQEQPPRYPFVEPTYKLDLMARQKNLSDDYGPFSVIIGLLRKKDESFVLDANYIPPSVSMRSCEGLKSLHKRFSSYLSDIKMALSIVLEKSLEQSVKTNLVKNIMMICRELLRCLSSVCFDWSNAYHTISPYRMVEMLNRLAGGMAVALKFMAKPEKEELLNYFKEWIGLAPSTFEQMIEEIVNRSYSHTRIGESFFVLECFLKNVQELFVALSHLEQIGGRRKEEMVIYFSDNQSEVNKGRESWLAANR
ncbi:MAG: type VI secretion system baseplate subunit TssK [Paludibacteraceae bacterium]|nr:type VI secretion system baseplate subunit TssK [Paludibacteraceae bacterium]